MNRGWHDLYGLLVMCAVCAVLVVLTSGCTSKNQIEQEARVACQDYGFTGVALVDCTNAITRVRVNE